MKRAYAVTRHVLEMYFVEIESDGEPTKAEVTAQAANPHTVRIQRETVTKLPKMPEAVLVAPGPEAHTQRRDRRERTSYPILRR